MSEPSPPFPPHAPPPPPGAGVSALPSCGSRAVKRYVAARAEARAAIGSAGQRPAAAPAGADAAYSGASSK